MEDGMPRALSLALVVGLLALAAGPAAADDRSRMVTETFTLEMTPITTTISASTQTFHGPIQGCLGFFTLRWPVARSKPADLVFSWTIVEGGSGYFSGADGMDGTQIYGGTAPGLGLWLGDDRQLHLLFGLGIGGGIFMAPLDGSVCDGDACGGGMGSRRLMLSPSVRIRYQTDGVLVLGLGLRALVPASKPELEEYGACLGLFFELGFSNWQRVVHPEPEGAVGAE
jgi:hypothetical protein